MFISISSVVIHGARRTGLQCFFAQFYFIVFVDGQYLYFDCLSELHDVTCVSDSVMGDF